MTQAAKKVSSSVKLYDILQKDICEGRIGDQLPSIMQLCDCYGVSHCTVKKVLDRLKADKYINGHKGKCIFVNKAALGNPLFQKNIVFYLHVNTMGNPYYLKVLARIRQLLEPSGSLVHFVNSPEQLAGLGFVPDAVVLSELSDREEIKEIEAVCTRKNIIRLNDLSQDYNAIGTDNYNGGYQAAEYLYKMGHRKVGMVSRDLCVGGDFFVNRFNGFKAFGNEHSDMKIYNSEVNMNEDLTVVVPMAMGKLLCESSEITAVFTFTDVLALGVYSYCAGKGLNIPDDISVLSFDDRDFSGLLSPALTTFAEDSEQVSRLVREMISRTITGQDGDTILVKPFLIERNSVKNVANSKTKKNTYA
jgi:DNA-binding LacI/PurR family transcriptional regulator